MVDADMIERRLLRLEHTLRKLGSAAQNTREAYLQDETVQDGVERNLQVAIQVCIDIASHLVASLGLRGPESYADLFSILREENLLSPGLSRTMQRMVGFRNILVHDYMDINAELVYGHLKSLDHFRQYAREILVVLESVKGDRPPPE